MINFPNGKINLGLNILSKRDDGFHNIETIFYPVALNDILEIITAPPSDEAIIYSYSGLNIGGEKENNLCIKASSLLKKDFPTLPHVKLHLHKTIPMGAGLGGGSADGAFTLTMLNEKYQLNISTQQLQIYAAALGSDGPFFIINQPAYATGRGELLETTNVNLSTYRIILVNPGIHINTAWAFSQITPAIPVQSIKAIIAQPITTWKDELKNDFENPVFEKYPEIKDIKDELYKQGALYAAMSGSGSTVFGIFETLPPTNLFPDRNYFIKIVS